MPFYLTLVAWMVPEISLVSGLDYFSGVKDSDVFVLFLTNSVLSRSFCLKEISWALQFQKPILIIIETEQRFWAWDYHRWTKDECARNGSGGWQHAPLQYSFTQCQAEYPDVVQLITNQHKTKSMLPFRRRDFEVNALVRELVRRAGHSGGVEWGRSLPTQPAEMRAQLSLPRSIWITASIPPAGELKAQLSQSICDLSPSVRIASSLEQSSHVLFLLTEGVMPLGCADDTSCSHELFRIKQLRLPTGIPYLARRHSLILTTCFSTSLPSSIPKPFHPCAPASTSCLGNGHFIPLHQTLDQNMLLSLSVSAPISPPPPLQLHQWSLYISLCAYIASVPSPCCSRPTCVCFFVCFLPSIACV